MGPPSALEVEGGACGAPDVAAADKCVGAPCYAISTILGAPKEIKGPIRRQRGLTRWRSFLFVCGLAG